MTELEAVGYVKTLPNRIPLKFFTEDGAKVYDEFAQVVTAALEKQIEKEPIAYKIHLSCYKTPLSSYKCPSCGYLDVDDEQEYCEYCGQKLDWSE